MEIVGRKNLELTKRALLSHLVYCSHHALRSPDKVATERWDPEIKEINSLLDAVEINLKREDPPRVISPYEGQTQIIDIKVLTGE